MNSFFRVTERLHLAFILMTELARLPKGARATLKAIAASIGVRDGYFEEVASALKAAKLIDGQAGRSGGYRLAKSKSAIRLSDIVTAIEGPVELVACHGKGCPLSDHCASRSVWAILRRDIVASLRQRTLADVA